MAFVALWLSWLLWLVWLLWFLLLYGFPGFLAFVACVAFVTFVTFVFKFGLHLALAFDFWLLVFGFGFIWLDFALAFGFTLLFFCFSWYFSASVLTSLFFMSEKRHFRTLVEYGLQLGEYLKHSM